MAAHVDHFTLKNILCVAGVRGINQRVLSAKDVIGIVALDRLVGESAGQRR
jgi:hypothetical protein